MGTRTKSDSGAVAIVTAIVVLVLISIGGLAVDLGNMWAQKRQMQTIADLSALAGGQSLPESGSVRCAMRRRNMADNIRQQFNLSNSDDPFLGTDPGWETDKNLENGEIQILNASGGPVSVTGTCGSGALNLNGAARRVRVTTPPRTIQYGLARAMGFDEGKVRAVAAVSLRSPGGLLPFALSVPGSANGESCS